MIFCDFPQNCVPTAAAALWQASLNATVEHCLCFIKTINLKIIGKVIAFPTRWDFLPAVCDTLEGEERFLVDREQGWAHPVPKPKQGTWDHLEVPGEFILPQSYKFLQVPVSAACSDGMISSLMTGKLWPVTPEPGTAPGGFWLCLGRWPSSQGGSGIPRIVIPLSLLPRTCCPRCENQKQKLPRTLKN